MRSRIAVGGILALAFVAGCSPRAQDRVVVAPKPRVAERRGPVREVIVVERTHVPRGRAYGWWKQHGYSEVTVYYDGASYYSRRDESTGFRAVIVFQRDGKYYLPAEDDHDDQGGRHGHDHDRDDQDNQD